MPFATACISEHTVLIYFSKLFLDAVATLGKNEKGSHPFHVPNWSGQKMAYI
jgi:hypothetical protein